MIYLLIYIYVLGSRTFVTKQENLAQISIINNRVHRPGLTFAFIVLRVEIYGKVMRNLQTGEMVNRLGATANGWSSFMCTVTKARLSGSSVCNLTQNMVVLCVACTCVCVYVCFLHEYLQTSSWGLFLQLMKVLVHFQSHEFLQPCDCFRMIFENEELKNRLESEMWDKWRLETTRACAL